jgi:hypothetical protein
VITSLDNPVQVRVPARLRVQAGVTVAGTGRVVGGDGRVVGGEGRLVAVVAVWAVVAV